MTARRIAELACPCCGRSYENYVSGWYAVVLIIEALLAILFALPMKAQQFGADQVYIQVGGHALSGSRP